MQLGCAFPAGAQEGRSRSHRIKMNQKELKELIEFLIEKDIAEFELERGDVKVRIRRGREPVASASAPDSSASSVMSAPAQNALALADISTMTETPGSAPTRSMAALSSR